MQATVLAFDQRTLSGTVVTDDGRTIPFDAPAFAAGGLRLLRAGQRIRAGLSPAGVITSITVITLADPLSSDH